MIEKFFTTEQVANILQVHPFTILKFIRDGRLRGIKLGRVYRIKESDVTEFLEGAASHKKAKPSTAPEKEEVKKEEHYKIDEKGEQGTGEHYYII